MRPKSIRYTLMVITALLGAVLVGAMPATGAQAQDACSLPAQYQGSATFAASASHVAPGSTVVFTGAGWPANTSVPITVDGASVGSATTNASGAFSFSYTFPASTSTGSHVVSAACGAFILSQSITVSSGGSVTPSVSTVSAPGGYSTGSTGSTLPVTGSNSIGVAQVALALLAAGGLLVLVTRRARAHA